MAIKTCLFDMGNVLVYFSHQKMCRNVASVCGVSEADVTALLLESGLQWQLERGEISEQEFHAGFEKSCGRSINFDALKHAAADIFRLNESIVSLIDELKRGGMRLVLLSNTSVTHLRFIQSNFDILERFDALTTSFEVGALKPDKAIYEDALDKAQCSPEHCFYTDDIEAYVQQARCFGIHAEVYSRTTTTRAALKALGVNISDL
ncbi:MAG: HAD family phosphatase [Planctomycetaceae bacterium]